MGKKRMKAHVYSGWSYRGIDAVTLENSYVRVDILTGLGAKIYNFVDLKTGENLLWHNPRRSPVVSPFGANFDDWWSGGWDEPFPNGAESLYKGEKYPFLGELWSLPWNMKIVEDGPNAVIHLSCRSVIMPAYVEKLITLHADRPILSFSHRIKNMGLEPLEFMWGIHPALRVKGHRIDIPAAKISVAESKNCDLGKPGFTYEWPNVVNNVGVAVDVRNTMTPEAKTYGLLYAHELRDGWLGVTAPNGGASLGLAFPKEVFKSVWLWLVYGGWRGHHHIAVEPWTGHPADLSEAAREGRVNTLSAGEVLEAEVTAVIYRGLSTVSSISRDGEVWGDAYDISTGHT